MAANPIRDGFHTVTPYLFADGATRLIEFVTSPLNGEVVFRQDNSDGSFMHAEVRLGNSMVMIGEASEEFGPMPSSIYLYVNDCDKVYQQALENGDISVFEMMNLPSGERYGGVKDPCGNVWWIATHVEDLSPEEQERRWREFKQ